MMKSRKGFTLIELLIVVVIIGILAAIAIPKFSNTKEKAYVAAMKADLRNLVTAEEAYFSDNAVYVDENGLTASMYRTSTGVTNLDIATGTGYFIATVEHTATNVKCVIEVGTGTRDGEPICA